MTNDKGAFVPPSDMYCKPEKAVGNGWEVEPIAELRDAGFHPCPVCFGDSK